MNNRYLNLVRRTCTGFCLAMICGGFTACKDDYDLDDEGNYPSWLGSSIYEALKDPSSLESSGQSVLTGTFNNYVRLIDDLGEAETLGKTGSKTIFPANDDAFARFFANNTWGVSKYEDLTTDMKKRLLHSSMLDNALLVEMLSNISNGSTSVLRGQALRHTTALKLINNINMWKKSDMPENNKYWKKYYDKGIHVISDGTEPTMIHFTEEQMTANGITTRGDNSDFEVITGTKYDANEHSAYIFRNKIINADVTCKNGYIHQMEDVLVPPGNMAELIRSNGESKLFSRMLDRFSAPYWNTSKAQNITKTYNDNAQQLGQELIDTVFEIRYFSLYSQGVNYEKNKFYDPDNIEEKNLLSYDPGWNTYDNGSSSAMYQDIAAMFVPTDEALEKYFLPGGSGEFLINAFGKKPNTKENLPENIDSIPMQNVKQLINNLMKNSFVGTVPSKFSHVMDAANDPMGITLDVLNKTPDGKYDVKIANNGVIYMLNKMFVTPELVAVSAPITLNDNMRIMNTAVYDGQSSSALGLGLNFYAYLLAMSANYAFFIPTDEAFGQYYVDPAYLNESQPRVLRFTYKSSSPYVTCSAYEYNPVTGAIGDLLATVPTTEFQSKLVDILNYHTIVLGSGEKLGDNGNKYYKTKHGGAVIFENGTVRSGDIVIDGQTVVPQIEKTYTQQNGTSYAINQVIQAPQQSVLSVIQSDTQFSEFEKLCSWHFDTADGEDFQVKDLMEFASDAMITTTATGRERYTAYQTFISNRGLTQNVNYFNSYNYTVYAPDNNAMQTAYGLGLPKWNDIKAIYDQYKDTWKDNKDNEDVINARNKVLAMVYEINSFIRYHFQDNSIFADNVIETGDFPTASSDTLGIRQKLTISGGGGNITVKDYSGQSINISNTFKNKLTRDYVFGDWKDTKKDQIVNKYKITTSSFAVVHAISTPFNTHKFSTDGNGKVIDNGRYDFKWAGQNATSRLAAFRKKFETTLYKLYDRDLQH